MIMSAVCLSWLEVSSILRLLCNCLGSIDKLSKFSDSCFNEAKTKALGARGGAGISVTVGDFLCFGELQNGE